MWKESYVLLTWDLAQLFLVTTLIIFSLEKDSVPNGRSLSSYKGLALNINIIHETGLETTHTISKVSSVSTETLILLPENTDSTVYFTLHQ